MAPIEPLSWGWKFMINLLSEPYSFQASPYLKLSNISLTDVIFLPFLTEFRGSFDVPGQAAAAKLITPAIFVEFRWEIPTPLDPTSLRQLSCDGTMFVFSRIIPKKTAVISVTRIDKDIHKVETDISRNRDSEAKKTTTTEGMNYSTTSASHLGHVFTERLERGEMVWPLPHSLMCLWEGCL